MAVKTSFEARRGTVVRRPRVSSSHFLSGGLERGLLFMHLTLLCRCPVGRVAKYLNVNLGRGDLKTLAEFETCGSNFERPAKDMLPECSAMHT